MYSFGVGEILLCVLSLNGSRKGEALDATRPIINTGGAAEIAYIQRGQKIGNGDPPIFICKSL